MFIINTDQGYIKGIPHENLNFTERWDARTFTGTETIEQVMSIIEDLHMYYCCTTVEIEYIN